jgi:hypothetical protein
MPYLEAQLNDVVIACAGADDLRMLSAQVIASSSGSVSVGAYGIRDVAPEGIEHLDLLSKFIAPGDKIQLALLSKADPTLPRSSGPQSTNPETIAEELKDMRAQFQERYPNGVPSVPRVAHPMILRVSVDQQSPITAALGDEEQLQVVLTWNQEAWALRVDSLTVLDGGHTKGHCWLRATLSPGQKVEVTYAP